MKRTAKNATRHCFDLARPAATFHRTIATAEYRSCGEEARDLLAELIHAEVPDGDVSVTPVDPTRALSALRFDIGGRTGEALRDLAVQTRMHPKEMIVRAIEARRAVLKREKKLTATIMHFFPVEGETLATLDAAARANGETRGAALGRLIENAAGRHGLDLRDWPMHREGASVECEPNRPGKQHLFRRTDGTTSTWCVYANIDGRLGAAFSELQAKWRIGAEATLARIVREQAQRA